MAYLFYFELDESINQCVTKYKFEPAEALCDDATEWESSTILHAR